LRRRSFRSRTRLAQAAGSMPQVTRRSWAAPSTSSGAISQRSG